MVKKFTPEKLHFDTILGRLREGHFSETRFAYAKVEGFRRKISLIEV